MIAVLSCVCVALLSQWVSTLIVRASARSIIREVLAEVQLERSGRHLRSVPPREEETGR